MDPQQHHRDPPFHRLASLDDLNASSARSEESQPPPPTFTMSKKNKYLKTSGCIANFLIVICLGLPSFVLYLVKPEPFQRGFFCDDPTIRHPYYDSTVTSVVLFFVCFTAPPLAIVVVETFFISGVCQKRNLKRKKTFDIGSKTVRIPDYLVRIYVYLLMYLFGAAACQLVTDTAKYTIGRLRPHFIDVCKPDWSRIECTDDEGHPVYVTDFTCKGNQFLFNDPQEREDRIHDARLSFLSGHASTSFQAMTFMALYLQARLVQRQRPPRSLLIPFVQFAGLMFAVFTSLSRVSDYKHNPGDVLAGAALGIAIQSVNSLFLVKLFRIKSPNVRDAEEGRVHEEALVISRENQVEEAEEDRELRREERRRQRRKSEEINPQRSRNHHHHHHQRHQDY